MNCPPDLLNRPGPSSPKPAGRPQPPRDFARTCRNLLAEAQAIGLNLEDVIDALRRLTNRSDQSN